MTELKIGNIEDEKPVELNVELPAALVCMITQTDLASAPIELVNLERAVAN